MNAPHERTGRTRSRRRVGAVVAALTTVALAVTALATAAIDRGGSAEAFAATFEARAVGDPTIAACRGLEGWQKIEGRYEGTFSIPAEERRLTARFSVEVLLDRSTGVGTAEGNWQLLEPPDPDVVAGGQLVAVVKALEPPDPDLEPPDPDLELRGLLIGNLEPPDPDLPAQRLVGNFVASLGEGATFPHLKGAVGDPSVADPTAPASTPAALVPAVKC